jgi:prepilin-type N-terminal cleavage/methylation domain-containing protein
MNTRRASDPWSEVRGQFVGCVFTRTRSPRCHTPLSTLRVRVNTHPTRLRGFTLVELLVTITIIGILASLAWGAVVMARNAAREAATKATIAKLNSIIMKRYESYMTRRVPIRIPPGTNPKDAAALRLYALRTLMRLEMPDSLADASAIPPMFHQYLPVEPPLHVLYRNNPPTANWDSAQCLYKVVSLGSPEAMEQFNASEIGVIATDLTNKKPVFIDGWGNPICWLRWAPGFSSGPGFGAPSDIQTGNPAADSDPFDPRKVDVDPTTKQPRAFHMIPLICSGGLGGTANLFAITGLADPVSQSRTTIITDMTNICGTTTLGAPGPGGARCITNHHIEQR